MMILRNPKTGEQVVTKDRAGYPGWKLIEKDVANPRGHSERIKGRWRINRERGRQATVEELKATIAQLEERLAKLEKDQNGRS